MDSNFFLREKRKGDRKKKKGERELGFSEGRGKWSGIH